MCIGPGGQFSCRYVILMATGHMVQSSLNVQDGVSFFFKMESAQPVPFLRRVYAPQFFVSSQQRCGVTDIQAPRGVTALRSWTDNIIALRSQMDRVIALRQISVTALFYLEDSRKIHLRGVRARLSKDAKRRESQRTGERARASFGSSFYMFLSPWACPV